MNDRAESYFDRVTGQVHTGDGNQYNIFPGADWLHPRKPGRSPLVISEIHLLELSQCFVPPPRLGRARDLLQDRRMLMLTGAAGSGRRAAALTLLDELKGDGTGECRELPDRADEEAQASSLDPEDVGSGYRLLLDLTESDAARLSSVQRDLVSFHTTVMARQAYLVVLLPTGSRQQTISADLSGFVGEIGRPDPVAVLRAHLKPHGIVTDREALNLPGLNEHLRDAPMAEIGQLAALILREREDRHGAGQVAEWVREAFASQTERSRQVADALAGELTTGPQRALLFATAVFEGSRSDVVHHATARLLKTVGQAPEAGTLLEHRDLAARLREIQAVTGIGDRVRFSSTGYAEAVRRHLWSALPDLRPRIGEWTGEILSHPVLDDGDRNNLIDRFTELCLRTERTAVVTAHIERWTSAGASKVHQAAATQALGRALQDPRHNRDVLERIYEWSKQQSLRRELTGPLITVCAGVMARHQPDRALVRLHHLARRNTSTTLPSARDALLDLAGSDNRLRRRMLNRVGPGLRDSRWEADIGLFLDVADADRFTDSTPRTRPLIAEADVRDDLTAGWRAVLPLPHRQWNEHARRWLETAQRRARYRTPLLRMLVDACDGRGDLLSLLYVTAYRWDRSAESFAGLKDLIDTAQGIRPLRTGA